MRAGADLRCSVGRPAVGWRNAHLAATMGKFFMPGAAPCWCSLHPCQPGALPLVSAGASGKDGAPRDFLPGGPLQRRQRQRRAARRGRAQLQVGCAELWAMQLQCQPAGTSGPRWAAPYASRCCGSVPLTWQPLVLGRRQLRCLQLLRPGCLAPSCTGSPRRCACRCCCCLQGGDPGVLGPHHHAQAAPAAGHRRGAV